LFCPIRRFLASTPPSLPLCTKVPVQQHKTLALNLSTVTTYIMVNSLQAPTVIVRHSLPQHSASSLFSVIAPFLNKNLRASLNSTALVQVNQFLLCHLLIYILSRTFQKPFHPSTFPSVSISAAPEHNSRQWTVDVCVLLKNWRTISAGDSTGYALALQVKTILLQTLGCTLASQL
jgi:hypothetical protein